MTAVNVALGCGGCVPVQVAVALGSAVLVGGTGVLVGGGVSM